MERLGWSGELLVFVALLSDFDVIICSCKVGHRTRILGRFSN
jgi:hypothetical protein